MSCSVIIAIPVLLVGGTEMQTINLVRTLVDNCCDVTVCCYYDHEACMIAAMEGVGARVVLLGLSRSSGLWHLIRRLARFFSEHHPDIVHVQYIAPGLIPILAARFAGVSTIFATMHQPGRTYGWKAKLLLRCAAWLSTVFFCNSLSVERSWFGWAVLFDPQNTAHSKHCTIYNAVDVEHISHIAEGTDRTLLRATLELGNQPVVGVVGRLRWEKGQSVLLEAIAVALRRVPSLQLLVVGDGPDRQELQIQAERLNITDNVRWLGQQNANEVFRLYSIMDVVVVPSIFEGFGLVAAEAMAAGRPVVGSEVDGLAEVIANHETGMLVPPQNADALSEALVSLIEFPETAAVMGSKGLRRVAAQFSFEKFSKHTIAAYAAYSGTGLQ